MAYLKRMSCWAYKKLRMWLANRLLHPLSSIFISTKRRLEPVGVDSVSRSYSLERRVVLGAIPVGVEPILKGVHRRRDNHLLFGREFHSFATLCEKQLTLASLVARFFRTFWW